MHANQVRLYFASFAYALMQTLRRVGLAGTELAKAQCGTIRDKVLKVGAQVRVSARRVCLSFAETWPRAALLGEVLANLGRCRCAAETPAPTGTTTGEPPGVPRAPTAPARRKTAEPRRSRRPKRPCRGTPVRFPRENRRPTRCGTRHGAKRAARTGQNPGNARW